MLTGIDVATLHDIVPARMHLDGKALVSGAGADANGVDYTHRVASAQAIVARAGALHCR